MSTTSRIIMMGGLAMAVLGGCRGDRSEKPPRQFLPDMDDSPKWKPQVKSEFYADGRAMRPAVPGTVPASRMNFSRDAVIARPDWALAYMAKNKKHLAVPGGADWELFQGAVVKTLEDGSESYDAGGKVFASIVERIPVPVTDALVSRGQERFNIYCSACHGYEGDGQGAVGKLWAGTPANFHDAKFKDPTTRLSKDGYLFYTAMNGFYDATKTQKMPAYGHALDPMDAWAIVAYLRVLQETRALKIDAIPEAERATLQANKPAPAPLGVSGGKP